MGIFLASRASTIGAVVCVGTDHYTESDVFMFRMFLYLYLVLYFIQILHLYFISCFTFIIILLFVLKRSHTFNDYGFCNEKCYGF